MTQDDKPQTSITKPRNKTPKGALGDAEAMIVMRVTNAQKNKWVKASQSEGKKLTAWLIEWIERS